MPVGVGVASGGEATSGTVGTATSCAGVATGIMETAVPDVGMTSSSEEFAAGGTGTAVAGMATFLGGEGEVAARAG